MEILNLKSTSHICTLLAPKDELKISFIAIIINELVGATRYQIKTKHQTSVTNIQKVTRHPPKSQNTKRAY